MVLAAFDAPFVAMGGPPLIGHGIVITKPAHREASVRAWLSLASASGFNRGYPGRVYTTTKESAGYSEGLTGSEGFVETAWASSRYTYELRCRSLDEVPGLESSYGTAQEDDFGLRNLYMHDEERRSLPNRIKGPSLPSLSCRLGVDRQHTVRVTRRGRSGVEGRGSYYVVYIN